MLKNPYKLHKENLSLFINVDDIVFYGNTAQFKETGDVKFSLHFSLNDLNLQICENDEPGSEINGNNSICLNQDFIIDFHPNEIGKGKQKPLVFKLYIHINKVKYLFGNFSFDFNMENEEFLELNLNRKNQNSTEGNDEIEFVNSVIDKPFSCSLFIRTYPENKSKVLTSSGFSNEIIVFNDILGNGNDPTSEEYSVRYVCETLTGGNGIAFNNENQNLYLNTFPTLFTLNNLIEIVNKKVFNDTNKANIENVYNYICSHTLDTYLTNLRKPNISNNDPKDSMILNGTDKTKLVYAICSALMFVNNHGNHHDGVIPLNIFIDDESKECKLTNFVISKGFNDKVKQFTDAMFYKPESKSASAIKYQQDIYSLGVIIYELLTNGNNPKRNDPSAHFKFDTNIIKNDEKIPQNAKTLLIAMLNENECLRPTVREIMIMIEGNQFAFPETNFDDVLNYVQKIKTSIQKDVFMLLVRYSQPILSSKKIVDDLNNENEVSKFSDLQKQVLKSYLNFQMGVNCYYEGDIEASTNFFRFGLNENCVFSKFMFDLIEKNYPENLVSNSTTNESVDKKDTILSFKEKYESSIKINEPNDYRKIVIEGILENPKDIKDMYILNTNPFIYKNKQKTPQLSAMINLYTKKANSGDSNSQFYLGNIFCYLGDYQKSQHYYELSTNQDHKFSANELGHFYQGKSHNELLIDKSKAIALYLKSAELGNAFAYGDIGCLYEHSNDNQNAEKYYQLAAKCGIASSLLNLGYFYQEGVVVKKDIKKAIELYQLSSCLEFFDGFYNLGLMYVTGNGVKVDMDKAIYYLLLACKKDVSDAFFNIGSIYKMQYGEDFPPEKMVKARYFYQLAADHNQAIGQYSLALIFMNEGQFEKAEYYFEKSVNNGNAESVPSFVKFLEAKANTIVHNIITDEKLSKKQKDEKVEKEINEIYKKIQILLETSASRGNFESMFILGKSFREGINGYPKDFGKAKYLLEIAAKQGRVIGAFFQLGRMYQEGQGVTKDDQKAFEYINIAASNGDERAMCNLGCIYLTGTCDVKQDKVKAFDLMKKAVEKGSNDALMNLSVIYEEGIPNYLKPNPKEAHRCRRRAIQNGLHLGCEMLAEDYLTGNGCKPNIDKALKYMNFVRENQPYNEENLFNLGVIYQDPSYDRVDYVKSMEMFRIAAELDHPIACHNLGLIYIQEKIVEKDLKKSFSYFLKAVENGYLDSIFNIAEFFLNGYDASIGFPKDINRALKYLCVLADNENQPNVEACLKVAKIYYNQYFIDENEGIEYIDLTKAAHYMKIAADRAEDREACHWMAQMYVNGDGVRANNEIAQSYKEKALKQGFVGFLSRGAPIIIKSDQPIQVHNL